MIDMSSVLSVYNKSVVESILKENPLMTDELNKMMVEEIREYRKLNNRHWKRKREIQEFVMRRIYKFIEVLEDEVEKRRIKTIRIKSYGSLPSKRGRKVK